MLSTSFVTNSSSVNYIVALAPDEVLPYFGALFEAAKDGGYCLDEARVMALPLDASYAHYVVDTADRWTEELEQRLKQLMARAFLEGKTVFEVEIPAGRVAEAALDKQPPFDVDSDVIFIAGP